MSGGANNNYWGNIGEAVRTLFHGLKLSIRHLWEARESRKPMGIEEENYFDQKEGIVTLQYPRESLPLPDNARYRLHNEIEDCIVCDKCAKICPVNCIEIEPIKAVDEDLGKTSDGTPKRIHAAKFDIDMGKCCFCGLCTTVCPTECLTMTKAYDFSEFDVAEHVYAFAEMTPMEILEKKEKLEAFKEAKAKPAEKPVTSSTSSPARPAFKPRVAAKPKPTQGIEQEEVKADPSAKAKPVFKPKVKPATTSAKEKPAEEPQKSPETGSDKPEPVFRPKIKRINKDEQGESEETEKQPAVSSKPKPVFRPKIKPVINPSQEEKEPEKTEAEKPKPKPVFKPKIKPVIKSRDMEEGEVDDKKAMPDKPRPVFKPKIKPRKED